MDVDVTPTNPSRQLGEGIEYWWPRYNEFDDEYYFILIGSTEKEEFSEHFRGIETGMVFPWCLQV